MDIKYDFSGQTAIVTGGSRGIGKAITTQLVKSGARVWTWDIAPIDFEGSRSLMVDVTEKDQIEEAISQILRDSPHIDILVNNAGCLGSYQSFEKF